MRFNYEDFKSDVYNALSNIAFKYREHGELDENKFDLAFEWFQTHFWEDEDLFYESLNESLGATDVVRDLYNTFPKIEFLDERDYGDDVALFFKLGGDISSLEDHLNDLGVDWKISNGKLRIVAPEDEDYLGEDCEVTLKSDIDEKEDAGDVEKGIENFNSMTESISFDEDVLLLQIRGKAEELMTSPEFGFPEEDIGDYLFIDADSHLDENGDEFFIVEVRAELDYDGLSKLANALNPIVNKIDKNAYFDMVTSGIIECWIKK